jgi:hypothetical protein
MLWLVDRHFATDGGRCDCFRVDGPAKAACVLARASVARAFHWKCVDQANHCDTGPTDHVSHCTSAKAVPFDLCRQAGSVLL